MNEEVEVETDRAFIELRGVHKAFGDLKVLDGVDLEVHHGKVLTILGGSGSGVVLCILRHLHHHFRRHLSR